MKQAGHKFLE